MSPITSHVLDLSRGRPARGVAVILESASGGGWKRLSRRTTNADGRVADLLPADFKLKKGVYRLRFQSSAYFRSSGVKSFYPEVPIVFSIAEPGQHYHVPLLISPFGYTTYRGS